MGKIGGKVFLLSTPTRKLLECELFSVISKGKKKFQRLDGGCLILNALMNCKQTVGVALSSVSRR